MHTQTEAFSHYLQTRYAQADAITPGQKIDVIQTLRQEIHELGRIPLTGGPVRVDVKNPAVQAALSGRAVSLDSGQTVKTAVTRAEGLAGLSGGKKAAILAGIFLIPMVIVAIVLLVSSRGNEEPVAQIPPTAVTTPNPMLAAIGIGQEKPTETPTITPSPPPPFTPSPPPPLPTAQVIVVTPTPFPALQISNRGHVAEAGNDPASLELAGFAYILTTGNVQNGLWEPRGAEWLQGTELRRVVTVPYEADLLAALFEMSAQETLRLRLRSGEIVAYRLAEVTRVSQTEIDILAAPYPSLAIILYGEEDTDARWVVIGEAIQSQSDFDTYSAGNTAAPSTSNLITAEGQEIVTDDLTLSVANCQPTDQVEGQSPPGRHQRFIICDITFEGTAVPAQEEIAIAITEWSWVQSAPDWLPYQPIDIALSDLNPGQSTTISFSGIVNKVPADRASDSRPVLLWQRADATYLIELEISDTGE